MISDLKIDYAYGINYELSNKKLITGFIKKVCIGDRYFSQNIERRKF